MYIKSCSIELLAIFSLCTHYDRHHDNIFISNVINGYYHFEENKKHSLRLFFVKQFKKFCLTALVMFCTTARMFIVQFFTVSQKIMIQICPMANSINNFNFNFNLNSKTYSKQMSIRTVQSSFIFFFMNIDVKRRNMGREICLCPAHIDILRSNNYTDKE